MTIKLVDIGVNLVHRSFDTDRADLINRAVNVGVSVMIITGTNIAASHKAQKLASQYPSVLYSTAGIHPHNARECNEQTLSNLRSLLQKKEVVAVGECGLDYNRDFSPRPVQDKWFEAQIQLACELKKPLFLHERDAHQRFVEILKSHQNQLDKVVVHCFTGNGHELKVYLDMGFYIGITGWICDERRGRHLQDLVKKIPLDKLMLETDAPFLTPRDLNPKPKDNRNEPSFLLHISNSIAKLLGKSQVEIAQITTNNAEQFFNLGK
ncbi:MAG: TatD family hydrolase [Blastocatellia bacterium]